MPISSNLFHLTDVMQRAYQVPLRWLPVLVRLPLSIYSILLIKEKRVCPWIRYVPELPTVTGFPPEQQYSGTNQDYFDHGHAIISNDLATYNTERWTKDKIAWNCIHPANREEMCLSHSSPCLPLSSRYEAESKPKHNGTHGTRHVLPSRLPVLAFHWHAPSLTRCQIDPDVEINNLNCIS